MSDKKTIITIILCSTLICVSILILASTNRYQYVNGMVFDKLTGNIKSEVNVSKTDDAVYALGEQAIKITDLFIAGEIDKYEADSRLHVICSMLTDLKIKNKSIIIVSDVIFLRGTISSYGGTYGGTTIEDVKKEASALTYRLNADK